MRRITNLEDALHSDASGDIRAHILNLLKQEELRLRDQLRLPGSSDSYHALQLCVDACEQTGRVIDVLWQRYHGVINFPS